MKRQDLCHQNTKENKRRETAAADIETRIQRLDWRWVTLLLLNQNQTNWGSESDKEAECFGRREQRVAAPQTYFFVIFLFKNFNHDKKEREKGSGSKSEMSQEKTQNKQWGEKNQDHCLYLLFPFWIHSQFSCLSRCCFILESFLSFSFEILSSRFFSRDEWGQILRHKCFPVKRRRDKTVTSSFIPLFLWFKSNSSSCQLNSHLVCLFAVFTEKGWQRILDLFLSILLISIVILNEKYLLFNQLLIHLQSFRLSSWHPSLVSPWKSGISLGLQSIEKGVTQKWLQNICHSRHFLVSLE